MGITKLIDLAVEDDEDLAELAEGGTLAGLTLDEIDCMTSVELRASLRAEREKTAAQDEVLAAKSRKIDEQATKLAQRGQKEPPKPDVPKAERDEHLEGLRVELMQRRVVALSAIQDVRAGVEALVDHVEGQGVNLVDVADDVKIAIDLQREAVEGLVVDFEPVTTLAGGRNKAIWDAVNAQIAAEDAQGAAPVATDAGDPALSTERWEAIDPEQEAAVLAGLEEREREAWAAADIHPLDRDAVMARLRPSMDAGVRERHDREEKKRHDREAGEAGEPAPSTRPDDSLNQKLQEELRDAFRGTPSPAAHEEPAGATDGRDG